MTNEQKLRADQAQADNNLIHLEKETRAAGQARDINAKIGLLESSLDDLQTELEVVNRSVDEGLERLSDSDLDLTAKVSETYKRLGEIDHTYKALSEISESIDAEVRMLTSEIAEVASQSAAGLESQNSAFTQQHEKLAERVNELVRHSKETNAQLVQSIQDNTDALLKLEQELVAEIEALASSTSERHDDLEKELESSKARILQLQSVDDALEKRAASLESTAARLNQTSRELEASLELLDMRTDELSSMIDKLLEDTEKHSSLLGTLQDKSIELAMSIRSLAGTQSRHFRILSGLLVLAIIAIGAVYFYHQSEFSRDAIVTAERTQAVDQQITGLKQHDLKSTVTMSELQDNLLALNQKLEGEVKALNGKLQTVSDQADSLDGRISSVSRFSRIGSSNVIHGPQWLSQQPADQYAVEVAAVTDRKAMYDIAQRYNRYLQDELSYYAVKSGNVDRYVLVSGGYATESEANAVIRRLPRRINYQQPAAARMSDIQQRL